MSREGSNKPQILRILSIVRILIQNFLCTYVQIPYYFTIAIKIYRTLSSFCRNRNPVVASHIQVSHDFCAIRRFVVIYVFREPG